MESTMGYTADPFSDPGLWQNESFLSNATAANTSSVYTLTISPVMNKTINILLVATLFITMVSVGCTMEVSQIKHRILNPKGVGMALLAQYGVMPLAAFCLAKAFQLAEMTALVVLICGCCPGGNISNLLALALQGDMSLSIVMTFCSMLLALGMMPLLLYIYTQGFANMQNFVPYVDITISLVLILIPCGTGILLNYYRPRYAKTIYKVGFTVTIISGVVTSTLICIAIKSAIVTVLTPSLTAIGALMPFAGYAFGYIISSLFKLNQSERRTITIEVGCQNVQLCSTILKMAFPPAMIGPLILFPVVYLFFQLMEAAVLIVLFRCHQRFALTENEPYQPANTEAT